MGRDCCGGFDDDFEDELETAPAKKEHAHSTANPSHEKELARLNRISGQLTGVKKMIEEQRYCPDILTQLRATRSAIKSLEANILEVHLGHCVADAMTAKDGSEVKKKIEELQEIFKRFED